MSKRFFVTNDLHENAELWGPYTLDKARRIARGMFGWRAVLELVSKRAGNLGWFDVVETYETEKTSV